jgi:hypothetical protein
MATEKYFVKSIALMMVAYNLPTTDSKGRRLSLILSRGDVSRALTEDEFNSPEVQKGLKGRDLLDVTSKMTK